MVAAALLSLDRRAFMQTMLGRPLVTGALVGACLGEPAAGLSLGLWTELLWLWRLTSGGYHTPNAPLALSAVLIALFGAGAEAPEDYWARAVLGFALIPVLAQALIPLDKLLRKLSGARSRRLRRLLEEAEAGDAEAARAGPRNAGEALAAASGEPLPGSPLPGTPPAAEKRGAPGAQGPAGETAAAEPPRAAKAAGPWPTARSLAPGAFRRAALAGLPETFLASLAFLAVAVPLVRLLARLAADFAPASFWAPLSAFAPYAPAAGLLGIAASLSRPSLSPFLMGAASALLALALCRAVAAMLL
jgi:hypothetical protein